MAALAACIPCPVFRIASPNWSTSRARVWARARLDDEDKLPIEQSTPSAGSVAASMLAYFGVLHLPLGVQGLSVVAELLQQDALGPVTKAVSLLGLQSMELAGALWLVTDSLKESAPTCKFRFRFGPEGGGAKNWAVGAGAGAALLLLAMMGSTAFIQQVGLPGRESEELGALRELLTGGGIMAALPTCLVVLGITPCMEEVVYRGFLLGCLTGFMPRPLAVVISSLVFAASHLTLAGFPGLFVVGLVLGLAYLRTENLATTFTIHCLYNMFIIVQLLVA